MEAKKFNHAIRVHSGDKIIVVGFSKANYTTEYNKVLREVTYLLTEYGVVYDLKAIAPVLLHEVDENAIFWLISVNHMCSVPRDTSCCPCASGPHVKSKCVLLKHRGKPRECLVQAAVAPPGTGL